MYDLGPGFPVDGIREVEPGTAILLSGPPSTDKRDLALEVLAAGQRRGEGAIVVSTTAATAIEEAYRSTLGEGTDDLRQFYIVEAVGNGSRDVGDHVFAADAPDDITGIGTGVARATERLDEAGVDRARVGLVSVTEMLRALEATDVFKFLHTLTARTDTLGYPFICTVDTAAVEERSVRMLTDAFDGVVELREVGGGREARAIGFPDVPVDWSPA